jgi:hypothetical protein
MKKPKCAGCNHLWEHHDRGGCHARYSAGPSGTFRCPCQETPPAATAPYEKPAKPRRLVTIAKWINTHLTDLFAVAVSGFCNTDRQIGRLRHPGKGRHGTRLIVYDRTRGEGRHYTSWPVVLDHNSAQTYRNNSEVERWLEHLIALLAEAKRKKALACPGYWCKGKVKISVSLKDATDARAKEGGAFLVGKCPKCHRGFTLDTLGKAPKPKRLKKVVEERAVRSLTRASGAERFMASQATTSRRRS